MNKFDKNNNPIPVELTNRFRLLGSPVDSAKFAELFFVEQIETLQATLDLLTNTLNDVHTKIKLFTQSIINIPHLLDSNVMHNYPIHNDAGKFWHNWNGLSIKGIDNITNKFFKSLLDINDDNPLPQHATLIRNLNLNRGGLRTLNASLRAAPDFVINTMISKR